MRLESWKACLGAMSVSGLMQNGQCVYIASRKSTSKSAQKESTKMLGICAIESTTNERKFDRTTEEVD